MKFGKDKNSLLEIFSADAIDRELEAVSKIEDIEAGAQQARLNSLTDQVQMVEETSGNLDILVDPNEVEALLPKSQEVLPLNKTEAGKLLGVTPFTLSAMLDGAGGKPLLTCIQDGQRGQVK